MMHWAYRIAEDLIKKYPEQDTFVCASGISPSGSVHIGNFREIVTTYFVVKALNQLGKKTRFIFSWDDYDRFRKVPKNVDESFSKYIGMPYAEIPCPYGCHNSYAEHFEKEFEGSLKEFDIFPEFIYQSNEYKSRRYNHFILHALKQRKEIYDILSKYKTGASSEKERANFYPVNVYCEACRKDTTTLTSFDEQDGTLKYSCSCGNGNMVHVLKAVNMKLNWKVDWPMRWMVENVVFEPGGRDHSSETGSYNVSKEIATLIFNYEAPMYEPYEFIRIKGTQEKMSSSSGNNLTPRDLLNVYTPENILFLFAKYLPNASFHIGLDDDVLRNYSEFERLREANHLNINNEDLKTALDLSLKKTMYTKEAKFSQVASILPLINFDRDLLKDVFEKTGDYDSLHELSLVSERVEFWIRNWNPQKLIQLNTEKDLTFYQTLSRDERSWLQDFVNVLQENENLEDEKMMKEVYAICHDHDPKMKKSNQKRLFTIIYKLVLNSSSGPRLPLLVHSIGRKKLVELLSFE